MQDKIKQLTIQPNPYTNTFRSHKRLAFLVQAKLENGIVQRRFFPTRDRANRWINELFASERMVVN